MNGYLLIDKPANWTSFDVVGKVRSVLSKQAGKKLKVGHAGTLDPFATGLLIVLVGSYTKKQDSFMKMDKTYEVEATLGTASTTGDPEGELSVQSKAVPAIDEVQRVLEQYVGEQQQTPPIFSAIKIDGKRAYKLAREGREVTIEPRTVTIRMISEVNYDYPKLTFTASVSSGTYIRSLVSDIGQSLGVGAFTSGLRRQSIDSYSIDDSFSLENAPEGQEAAFILQHLRFQENEAETAQGAS